MTTKLAKWGNSLGLRLPKYVEERLAIGPGDYVFVTVTDANEIVVRPVKQKKAHPGYAPLTSTSKVKKIDDEVDDW
jgi:AbrB family looped-hinge helix DNA binding protein